MTLDKSTFNHILFKITDSTAFGTLVSKYSRYVRILDSIQTSKGKNITHKNNSATINGRWEFYQVSVDYETIEPDMCHIANCDDWQPCPGGGSHTEYHSESWWGWNWIDDDDWYNPPGGGGGGDGFAYIPVQDDGNLLAGPHGFYASRIDELNALLALNPFALESCDSLNIMPFETYGPMRQRVAQFTVPQNVIHRLDSLSIVLAPNVYTNMFGNSFNVQTLTNAFGSVVNCDFFPIHISQMPLHSNGIPFTPLELLEYFRKNTTDFIDTALRITFSPYVYGNFNDSLNWNLSYGNSNGTLIHLKMPNDGTVVQSNYENLFNSTTNYSIDRFMYSTIMSPLDFNHPVSGNREFGIYTDSSGGFVFYTMGVDRITDWMNALGDWEETLRTGKSGFDKADALWTSMQNNMLLFISSHQGQADFYQNHNTKARPKWNDVKEFLMKHIDFAELKRRLGC